MEHESRKRVRQVAVAAAIFAVIAAAMAALLVGWPFVPGLTGEWLGTIAGLVTTPFLLEAFFAALGLTIVGLIHSCRRAEIEDEWRDVEIPEALEAKIQRPASEEEGR